MPSSSASGAFPDSKNLYPFVTQVIQNPKLLEQVTERVYELLQETLCHQNEQLRDYKQGRGLI